MKKIFTHLFAVLLLSLVSASAWAQTTLENGCVYHFQNGYFTGRAITAVEGNLAAVNATATNQADIKQLWYATQSGDNWIFRNLYNGRYLSQTGRDNWGLTDTDTAASNVFTYIVAGDTKNTIRSTAVSDDGNGYMHLGTEGQTNVAGWGSGSGGTQWVVTKKDYSADAITELLATAVSTFPTAVAFQAQLDAIFEDAACTKLNSTYTAMTEEQILADENYKALSTPLRDMVLKVKGGDWAEDNADATKHEGGLDWETKYAQKFRVQMYEPYSIAGDITSWLGINAHANNDNPTGIYVPEAGYLYVMVEGEIEDGASLRLVNGGHNWRIGNATGDGYALSPGLNVINYTEATGMLYVCYNVDTYNPDGTTVDEKFQHKLSDYAPLKIHIEGGAINGYYNACGDFRATAQDGSDNLWKTISGANVDCDEDWVYMETRANLNVLPVLGHRQILLFQLEDTGGNSGMKTLLPESISVPTVPHSRTEEWSDFNMSLNTSTHKINIMMEAWDRIIYSEHATMGLLSDEDMDKMNDLFPRWKADKSYAEIYDYTGASVIDDKTYREFCQGVDYSEYFNHHGVALGTESGYMYGGWDHCGYHINTFGSIVSKLAYEAGPTWGPAHEIGHQHQGIFNLNGQTEVTNNFFSNVAVWYMGMGTSRYNGSNGSLESVLDAYNTENNDAYTNNIWALTHIYYRLWLYYHLAGNNTQFWPRLFELLRNERLQNGGQISGDRSLLLFYKHACDAAGEDLTEFFRAHGYLEVMDNRLVGDYSNATYNQTQEMVDEAIAYVESKWSKKNYSILFINDGTSETTLQHNGTDSRSLWDGSATAELGSVTDFIEGNTDVSVDYSATVSDDGTVTMSGEGGVGFLVLNEDGELVSFSNKSTFELSSEAAYLLATGKATIFAVNGENEKEEVAVDLSATRFALLQELINNAEALASNTSETRVGFYKPSAVENLQEYVTMAQEVVANGDLANLQAVYELLYAEYNAVVANEFSRVPLVPGSKYAILAKTNDRILSFSDTTVVTVAATEDYASTANNQWYVERDGAFHIKNAGNSKYIQNVTDQNGVLYTVGDEVVNMNINEIQLGCYSIATSTVPGRYLNMDGANNARVITWGDTGNNSQWKFILLEENETNAAKEDLLELAKKTLALVDVVGTVEYTEGNKIELQSTNSGNANYIWSNAAVSGNDVDKLLDSDKNTFFHSQWNNSTAPADGWGHHLTVDLGENPSLTSFKFKFTTRNQSNLSNYPKTIEVYGSADNSTYTKLQVASGFATGAGVDNEAVVMGNGTAYRYLRFLVTDASVSNAGTNTGADGKVFFHMSEFSLYPITVTTSVKSDYTSGVTSDAVMNAFVDAEQAKSVYNNASATIDDINVKKTALQSDDETSGSYVTLLNQYNAVVSSVLAEKKAQLLTLITNTNSLIESVGSVVVQGPQKVALAGKLYAYTPYTAGGVNHADYSSAANNYNLLDGDSTTYFHSDYSANMPDVPYIRVDLGDGNEVKEFTFNYTTRSTGTGYPTTIKVYGANTQISYDDVKDSEPLATFTTSDANNAMPTSYGSWTSEDIVSETPYRYFVFAVTSSSVTKEYDNVERPYFVMSEFGFTEGGSVDVNLTNTSTKVDEALLLDSYLATAKSQKLHDAATTVALLDAAIADQQAAYDKLDKAIKTPADLDKSGLEELVALAQPLYDKMATDGVVNVDYAPSALTNAQLTAASDALAAANEALENATSQAALDEAKATLQTAYDALLAVENANEKNTITTTDLSTLIGSVEALLERVAITGTSKGEIALQAGDANSEFYIWSNAPASDCNDYSNKVEGLIDVNEDGSANTGTFFGTAWGSAVAAYTHYLEVDLGVATSINKLSMDYTTRASGYENQRPTAIKILGSNNKVDYTEVTTIEEGLATGACEQWAMETPLELGARYRYIRFAVATQEATGYFNMSDFNLYSISDKQFSDYYSTADADLNALLLALEVAKDALSRHYLTSAQYTAIKEKLNSVYNDVNNVIALDYTTRDDLTTLITNTETLINKVATVTEVPAVTLTEGILYCNADNKTNSSAGADDKLGVAALLDGKVSTHLHTTYGGNAQDDDLDHYIRVDLGDASVVTAFKFNYKGRQANSNNAPTNMTVEAGNSIEAGAEWVTLATLSELPTGTAPVSYESELIEMSEAYRYVRFMVTDTYNHDTTTPSGGTAHKFFVMSEFGFTAYPTVEVDENYPRVTTALVRTAYNEKNSANNVATCYMTESDYNAALAALQADYDALVAASQVDKTELEELIAATTILKNRMYEIESYTANEITLQNDTEGAAGYLYCNAAGSTNNYSGDNLGVDALLDNDTNTSNFLHTTYYGNDNKDGLDHYLRVDLGESKEYIRFRYKGRSGYAALTPKNAVVQATNDLSGEWTNIATLYGLTQTTDEVSTACLGNGVAYRYWRFMVTATYDGRKHDGHPYYALSAFNVDVCTDVVISSQLKSEYNPEIYIYTTSTLVTEVENAITEAETVVDNEGASQTDVNSEVDALQAVYDKLEEALKYAGIPVVITTDEENPVLYRIISKRANDDSKVLQFDEPATDKVAIVATANNASYQAWYFMQGEYGYLIKPFNGCGKVLSVESTGDGSAKANIAEESENIYSEWNFSRSAVEGCTDYFYIYVNGTSHACLSHNGGFNVTDKLGIWASGWNTDDDGSLFKFVEAEFDNDNARFYQLSDFENTLEYQTADTPEGEMVGAFVNGAAYSEAYTAASTLITVGNTSDATACREAYTALRTASENLEEIVIEEGKYYRIDITPGLTDNRAGASMCIDDKGKLAWGEFVDADARFYFTFEYDSDDNLYMKNLHTATYLDEALADNANIQVGADAELAGDAKKVAVNRLGVCNEKVVLSITPDGGAMLNCKAEDPYIVTYNNTDVDKASAWVITEVDEISGVMENVVHSVSLGADESGSGKAYSTLYLGYNATIPEGVTASVVTEINEIGQLVMEEVTGDILPAKTAVVLSGENAGGAEFKYADGEPSFSTEDNILKGTSYTKLENCGNSHNIYMLGKKSGRVAFYRAYENRNASGDKVTVEGMGTNHNEGGYVQCNANKAYLMVPEENAQAAAAMFGFHFGGNTTDIDSINAVADTYDNVYDLQGRKLEEITSPGIYIVNGKKVLVK